MIDDESFYVTIYGENKINPQIRKRFSQQFLLKPEKPGKVPVVCFKQSGNSGDSLLQLDINVTVK